MRPRIHISNAQLLLMTDDSEVRITLCHTSFVGVTVNPSGAYYLGADEIRRLLARYIPFNQGSSNA